MVNANTHFQLSFTVPNDGIISLTPGHNVCLENHVWILHLSNHETRKFTGPALPVSEDSAVSTDETVTRDYGECYKPRNSPFGPLV